MKSASKITDQLTMYVFLIICLYELTIRYLFKIDLDSLSGNQLLAKAIVLIAPTFYVLIKLLLHKEKIIYDRKYLVRSECIATIAFVICCLCGSTIILTVIPWLIITALVAACYISLTRKGI